MTLDFDSIKFDDCDTFVSGGDERIKKLLDFSEKTEFEYIREYVNEQKFAEQLGYELEGEALISYIAANRSYVKSMSEKSMDIPLMLIKNIIDGCNIARSFMEYISLYKETKIKSSITDPYEEDYASTLEWDANKNWLDIDGDNEKIIKSISRDYGNNETTITYTIRKPNIPNYINFDKPENTYINTETKETDDRG